MTRDRGQVPLRTLVAALAVSLVLWALIAAAVIRLT